MDPLDALSPPTPGPREAPSPGFSEVLAALGTNAAAAPAPPAAPTPVTADQIRQIMPNAGTKADDYADALNQAMAAHGITTLPQRAAFLGQISVESGGLHDTEENLDYSARRAHEVWPRRFPTEKSAEPYAHDPEKLGNHVYADRNGNGDETSGDGYRFRGRGLIQVTGRDNYAAVGHETDPESLATPSVAADTAASWWHAQGLDGRTTTTLDRHAFDGITSTVNGGGNAAQARWNAYQRALTALAPAPATAQ